jgi:hypothetical protein
MARKVVLLLLVLAGAGIPAQAIAARVPTARITVKPATGTPTTRFAVSFRAPQTTGRFGFLNRQYILSASATETAKTAPAPGCVSDVSITLPPVRAHARARTVLDPRQHGGRWCAGAFHGQIEEIEGPVCPKGELCPAFVVLVGTIGRFSFHVNKIAGGDTTPTTFAGLQHAFACTPGPQRPGETTPFNLSWNPATDDVTPSSQIVYEIFRSTTPGAEDYSKPTWTTQPGVTTFRTAGLASHEPVYFVVRAMDLAGNVDQNRVERAGVDPCV